MAVTCMYLVCIVHSVNLLIELLVQRKLVSNDATLLTLLPLEIAGKDVQSEFHEYTPPES